MDNALELINILEKKCKIDAKTGLNSTGYQTHESGNCIELLNKSLFRKKTTKSTINGKNGGCGYVGCCGCCYVMRIANVG